MVNNLLHIRGPNTILGTTPQVLTPSLHAVRERRESEGRYETNVKPEVEAL